MEHKHTAIVEKTNTGYSAYIKNLNGIGTTGDDLMELKKNITEALTLYYKNNNFSFTMEDETIKGYKDDFKFDLHYESYKEYVNGLQTVYHRLIWNFPNHEIISYWLIRKEYWRNYEKIQQGYTAFNSIEELEEEVNKILPEYVLSDALEKSLIELNKK
jgi:predicted RNase H-like HicB family nuclease